MESAKKAYIKDPNWIAPLLWRSEFRNVLALYLRKNLISLSQANLIMKNAELLMHSKEYSVNSIDVLELVNTSSCSAYDCEFVALAKDLNIKLVTVDKKIIREFPKVVLSLDEFLS